MVGLEDGPNPVFPDVSFFFCGRKLMVVGW